MARLAEGAQLAIGEIEDQVGGARLAGTSLIEQGVEALTASMVLEIAGAPGVGKSAVMKHMVERIAPEGRLIVLRNGRIVGGGWQQMSHQLGCTVPSNRFFNELAAAGGATLFVDNIDQIDDPKERSTVEDLLLVVAEYRGWRAVVTTSEGGEDWTSILPISLKASLTRLTVPEISDEEADQLSEQNTALAALLAKDHPAESIARNLFYLSRMVTLDAGSQAAGGPSTEIDLARLWWSYGGGRSKDSGRFGRLKALRAMGADILAQTNRVASKADKLESPVVAELLRLDAIREEIQGAEVAFRHDVLRDWTIGFMLWENIDFLSELAKNDPLPATVARGLEMAARIALTEDGTGDAWLKLLAATSGDGVHSSWRRPILLAPLRSERSIPHLNELSTPLLANKGRLLAEMVRLLVVVDSEPVSRLFARVQPSVVPAEVSDLVFPKGPAWLPMIIWLAANAKHLPHAVIPDVTKAFMAWLMATSQQEFQPNGVIVAILFDWLTLLDAACRPRIILKGEEAPPPVDVPHIRDAQEGVRVAAFSFAQLNPDAARKYVTGLNADGVSYPEFQIILKARGALAQAAPAELAESAQRVHRERGP